MELTNKNILIVGLGASGMAAARFLKRRGAKVTVTDIAAEKELAEQVKLARQMGLGMELGQHNIKTFKGADLIVISPGVPHTIGPLEQARRQGIPVWGEIELAARFIRKPVIAITGTNGKTTTTTLLGKMLQNSGLEVFVGGNIGRPLISYADRPESADVVVAEISSFQLDTIETFRPKVAVLLNITADHLDRYADFGAYIRSKGRIFENQQADDIAVINGRDVRIGAIGKGIKARKVFFTHHDDRREATSDGAVISWNGSRNHAVINLQLGKMPPSTLQITGSNLKGRHNLENAAAASLAALAIGGTVEAVQSALNEFEALSHRIEFVDRVNNIDFFNDSKATNIDAVARALESFDHPVVLIMGGRDKGGNFSELKQQIRRHVKKLIVMGEARDNIRSAVEKECRQGVHAAADMADAVRLAYDGSSSGDVVLLSPGCASFDMYDSYAQRGEDFRAAVEKLKALNSLTS